MRIFIVLAAFPLCFACAGMPEMRPLEVKKNDDRLRRCSAPFIAGRWRLIHSINGTMPGGATATMMGVSVVSSKTGSLRCSLLSIEGLVLMDAEYDGGLTIRRGIGPFGSRDFVMGVIRDIRLMLFRPPGDPKTGLTRDGRFTARYRVDGGTVDLVTGRTGNNVELYLYDASNSVTRTVRFGPPREDGIPRTMELEARSPARYSLQLELIEAEPVK